MPSDPIARLAFALDVLLVVFALLATALLFRGIYDEIALGRGLQWTTIAGLTAIAIVGWIWDGVHPEQEEVQDG